VSGHTDLYVAHFNAAQSRFDTAQALITLNTADDETAPSVTPDGLGLYFARNRVSTADPPHLFRALRSGTAAPFAGPVEATELNDPSFQEVGIAFDPTGCTAVFTTDRGSGAIGDFDLWTAHKSN
jgi:uncharacterized protein (DUF3084 family)